MGTTLDELVLNTRLADLLDIALIALVLYGLVRWLRRQAARAVVMVIVLVAVIYSLARVLGMYLTLSIFQAGLTLILVSLVIIFQRDIRYAFERLSAWTPFASRDRQPTDRWLDVLDESVAMMAQQHIGALIVLAGRQPLQHHTTGGVPANAELSTAMLHSLFNPASPGHDGAVVIETRKIASFSVHLPLSRSALTLGDTGGTRHAAARGLAERSDALVIVVSEERGTISVAEDGQLDELETIAQLRQRIETFQQRRWPATSPRRAFRHAFSDLGVKLGCLALAALLWFTVAFKVETVHRNFDDVAIEFRNLPDHWRVEKVDPETVSVTLTGPERAFAGLQREDLSISLEIDELREGLVTVPITAEDVNLPVGVQLETSDLPVLRVRLYRQDAAPSEDAATGAPESASAAQIST